MVLWLLGVLVFWLEVKIYFKGLACGRELVVGCWLLVFWLEVKSNFEGLAFGVVKVGPRRALLQNPPNRNRAAERPTTAGGRLVVSINPTGA